MHAIGCVIGLDGISAKGGTDATAYIDASCSRSYRSSMISCCYHHTVLLCRGARVRAASQQGGTFCGVHIDRAIPDAFVGII